MKETELKYLNDPEEVTGQAKLLAVQETEDGRIAIILDSTLFYPQGGGQPSDRGTISSSDGKFEVMDTRFKDGIVLHYGEFIQGTIELESNVQLSVNEERRMINNRNHTAGHLIDVAMYNCDFRFLPAKGYHFPDSPYVEYVGTIDAEERPEAIKLLNAELGRLILENTKVNWEIVESKEDLKETCKFIPDYLPEGKPIRVVTVSDIGCPCGGTHVKQLKDLGGVLVHKIKAKSGNTRISYRLT
ncbi:MAG: Ser-tRNA(Ala) deacylase AlaX [Crocinitomicaceae bacterium]|jgi:Ser-tRNA(Ala) deacylase AlaX